MAIVTLSEAKIYTHVDHDDEDVLMLSLINAAQSHIERLLGFRIEETFGGADQEPIPQDLKHAVRELVSWWYDNRAAADEARREMPFGVREIVTEYREYTF